MKYDETGYYYIIDVASTDIQPDNGIVHSLAYGYTFGQL